MKIIDHSREFLFKLSMCKEFVTFAEQYSQGEVFLDKEVLLKNMIEKMSMSIDNVEQKINERDQFYSIGRMSSIVYSLDSLSSTSKDVKASYFVNEDGDRVYITMAEYFFWKNLEELKLKNKNLSEEDNASYRVQNYFNDFFESVRGGSGKEYGYIYFYNLYKYETICKFIEEFVFYLGSKDNLTLYAESLKAYLFPVVNEDINFINICKKLEGTTNKRLAEEWENSGLSYSKDPEFFKYKFGKIKRKSGYVEEKRRLIYRAIDAGVTDKKLFQLFIKKSTITIRRSLADYFESRENQLVRLKSNAVSFLDLYKSDYEKDSESSYFRSLKRHDMEDFRVIDFSDYYSFSQEDKLAYLDSILDFVSKERAKVQDGLIAISQEQDYSVQRVVVNCISKENSVWVIPNITHGYLKRQLNEKIMGV